VENGRQSNAGKFSACLFLRHVEKCFDIYIVDQSIILPYFLFMLQPHIVLEESFPHTFENAPTSFALSLVCLHLPENTCEARNVRERRKCELILSNNYFLHIFFCLGQFNDVIRPSNSVRLPASLRHIPGTSRDQGEGTQPPSLLCRDAHTKRQATQHGCLPSLLGNGDRGIEIMFGEEKKIFVLGQQGQLRQDKNLLYRHDKPNEPTKKELFHLSSLSPYTPQFQQSAGVTPL
jgi:hypothetical protein